MSNDQGDGDDSRAEPATTGAEPAVPTAPAAPAAPEPSGSLGQGSGSSDRLYRRVVYARVTEAEWEAIRHRAGESGVSMSRYLVQSALTRTPLPTRQERDRSADTLYRLRRTAIRLRQLSGLQWMQSADPETAQMARETASLLEGLIAAMTRRLFGAGRGGPG